MKPSYVLMFAWMNVACSSESAAPTPEPAPSLQPDAGACAALTTANCDTAYDCVNFSAAMTKWIATCNEYTVNVRREGCGFDILQHTYGEGDTLLAFYHRESGELKGWWRHADTGDAECAGSVPDECAGYESGTNQCESSTDTPDTGVVEPDRT